MPSSGWAWDAKDFYLEVAMGRVTGRTLVHQVGRNQNVGPADAVAIWPVGGSYPGHDAVTAQVVEIFSGDLNDNALGSGARIVEVFGLDAEYRSVNESIAMNGTTPVDTVNSYIRMDRAVVRKAGASGWNVGNITARQKLTPANIFALIPSTFNVTMQATFTVPIDKIAFVSGWHANIGKRSSAFSTVKLRCRPSGQVFQIRDVMDLAAAGTSYIPREFRAPKNAGLIAKSDIFIEADSTLNDNAVTAGFGLLLISTVGESVSSPPSTVSLQT